MSLFFLRFLRSLFHGSGGGATSASSSTPAGYEPIGVATGISRTDYLRSLGNKREHERGHLDGPPPSDHQKVLNVDFSLESILQFKDEHREHTAHTSNQGFKRRHRVRPNYDNRKRSFLSARPVDRKQYLSL